MELGWLTDQPQKDSLIPFPANEMILVDWEAFSTFGPEEWKQWYKTKNKNKNRWKWDQWRRVTSSVVKKKEKEPDRSIEVTKWQIGIPNMSVFDRYNPNSLVLLLFMMTEAPSMLINRAPLTRIDST